MKALNLLKWNASMMGLLSLVVMAACSGPKQTSGDVAANLDNSQGILGGQLVDANDPIATSTVAIVSLSHGSVICTGSLISGNTVITAAHCTAKELQPLAVLFSRRMWKSEQDVKDDMANKLLLKVDSGIVNSLFSKVTKDQKTNWGDMAILRIQGDLPAGYAPAKLLATGSALQNGMNVTLAGYGLIDGAKEIDTDGLRRVDISLTNASYSESEVLFDQSAGKGGCHGDSGGPAFVTVNGKQLLFGITSRASDDTHAKDCLGGAIYTNLSAYIPWIKAAVTKLNAPATGVTPGPQASK